MRCEAAIHRDQFRFAVTTDSQQVGAALMVKNLLMPQSLITGGSFAVIFLLFSWHRSRTFKNWWAMKSLGLNLFFYGLLFVALESYLMILFADLKWPRILLYICIGSFGVLLSPGPWSRRLRPKQDSDVAQK
jgi:hypothetical protein